MSRSRMFDDQAPHRKEEPASPRKTIVGGRPPEPPLEVPPVPTGIQRLLRLASSDAAFRSELLEKRDEVAARVGVELTSTERAVLRAASEAQLDAMAKHLPPAPSVPRRELMLRAAAAAAALVGGPALLACESCTPGPQGVPAGVRPDIPPPGPASGSASDGGAEPGPGPEPEPVRPDENQMQTEGGAAPHEPPPPRPHDYPAPTGIAPDLPPKRK